MSGLITGTAFAGLLGLLGIPLGMAGVPGFTSQTDAEAQGKPVYGKPMSQADFLGKSSVHQPSPDAARFSGMTGAQVLNQQRVDVGLPPPGQPYYSGVGPRGPGSSVGAMPPSIASAMGGGGIAPFDNMMRAAQSQVASGGGSTGQAMQQHIQKAVQVAAPAASVGGASIGAAMNTGMAQGQNSTQSVVDTGDDQAHQACDRPCVRHHGRPLAVD
jgi:hypothetical protein